MRIVETRVYQYDELSESAKGKARDWYRETAADDFSTFGAESVIEQAVTACKLLGIEIATRTARLMGGGTRQEPQIYWSGFWSQGDGACFEGTYAYRKGSVAAITAEFPQDERLQRIARELQTIQRRHFYRLQASIRHTGRYSHEHSVSIEIEDSHDTYRAIDPADADGITECLRDVMRWIYQSLQDEYEYQNADEQVAETIRANEYEFDEEGRRHA